ncbi:MAG: AI-2E family transporter [Thomasclavelia sp.]|nr:AI-2E family transporter [Thomasclavelia sp.]
MNIKETIKKYNPLFVIGILLILIYKLLETTFLSTLLYAFQPVIIGAVLAYFLQPLVVGVENKLKKTSVKKYARIISTLIIFIGFILILCILLWYFIPIIINNVVSFANNIGHYANSFEETIKSNVDNVSIRNAILEFEQTALNWTSNVKGIKVDVAFNYISTASSTIITILLGLIFCPYILIELNRLSIIFDKLMKIFVSDYNLALIHKYIRRTNEIFGRFIYGKFIDSVIIGIIACVGFGILGLKFFPLLALIILVTNMIPYFGPFIGAIPVVFVALITNGLMTALVTVIFIFILQQFDGLILGPRILGGTVGISPFWIITSITVFGSLWGVIGMFLGVPIICVIRMFFNDYIEYQENKKIQDS